MLAFRFGASRGTPGDSNLAPLRILGLALKRMVRTANESSFGLFEQSPTPPIDLAPRSRLHLAPVAAIARAIGCIPSLTHHALTGAGGMVNTEVLDHVHRDFPRLVPPRRDLVLGRRPLAALFFFANP